MGSADDDTRLSRRDVLRASGGAFGFGFLPWDDSDDDQTTGFDVTIPCPDVSVGASMEHYSHEGMHNCADDHPATAEIQTAVRESLETNYPTVGSLIDQGYVPYFDFLAEQGERGWSHWLNPAYIDDDSVLDPGRPESILVDHKWWRPMGVMFIATRDGNRVDPPPAVYDDDDQCLPWHAHTGLPGLKAWAKYWTVYGDFAVSEVLEFPCRTPWMMHVWAYPRPGSVYAHGAPARGHRGGPPAEPAGFDTSAEPGEDLLGPDVLPDALIHRVSHLEL